ncbi:YceI family protein [Hymenobacter sp. BT188]|uniref:YceI family protein n=1 Tax=Hymenobacter sp. BT188 TaxID=2763504 RepID=UPI001650DA2F|nr:YceI family protein [Hymenobacter sp. BT188]MBC6606719.1 YceI family protein [Hymenobacter sp. BT188]
MKTLLLTLIVTICLGFRAAATTYQALPAASQLTWTGYAEAGSWAPSGTLQLRRGTFVYEGSTLRQGRFEFDMSTITHTDATLQRHLRGADFFDAERFPVAVFVLREVVKGQAVGELTLKGIAKPVRFPVTITTQPEGLRIQGTATIDRTQFGVNYNSSSFFQNLGSYAIRNDFTLAFDVLAKADK